MTMGKGKNNKKTKDVERRWTNEQKPKTERNSLELMKTRKQIVEHYGWSKKIGASR